MGCGVRGRGGGAARMDGARSRPGVNPRPAAPTRRAQPTTKKPTPRYEFQDVHSLLRRVTDVLQLQPLAVGPSGQRSENSHREPAPSAVQKSSLGFFAGRCISEVARTRRRGAKRGFIFDRRLVLA